jgi:beta-glucosidase
VIGPNAAPIRLGGYSGNPGCAIAVVEGIRQKVGSTIEVLYAEGCGITQSTNDAGQMWNDDLALQPDPVRDAGLISEAVQTAEQADVTLLVLGDNEQTCREGWSVDHLGDRDTLDLPGRQEALLRAVVAVGKPVILLLIQGRPASINFAAEYVAAILEGWYLGEAAGTAVADVLFGDVNPGGKLPITFPRSVGQLPAYYYHKPSARRGYLFSDKEPLFPFGHGLSYTTFAYNNLRLSSETIRPNETATLSVDVTNTGSRAGDEVVQFYVHDVLSGYVTRPVKLLKGFQRITLQAGEFELMVGGNSQQVQKIVLVVK